MNSIPFIEAHNLSLKYLGRYLYDNVSLCARQGEVLALLGGNGSGKTPLLLTLAGRMKATSGSLRIGDVRLPRHRRTAMRQVGLSLFRGANDLQDSLAVRYAVKMELELYGRPANRQAVEAYLAEWDLSSLANERVKNLTARQTAELGIALAFVGRPQAVMVDDVESRLTLLESKALMALLTQQARERHVAVCVGVVESMLAKGADVQLRLPDYRAGERTFAL
ncbi:MAG: ATP-binding cassette domain-containing protein, partial [Eggerthellaceae bacterium]|nr:ATP-binding cassette domain-containing protein [Eggerthellaceae bacterium]